MYCQQCGSKIPDTDARFCPNCGTQLAVEPKQKSTEEQAEERVIENPNNGPLVAIINTAEEETRVQKRRFIKSALVWPIAIPVFSLVISAGSGYAYYSHQIETNKSVTSLKEKAENDALKGQYAQALSSIKKAKTLRPNYKVLIEDEEKITKAIKAESSLKEISNSLKTQQIDKADSQINKLKITLQTLKGPLYALLNNQLEEKSTTLAVAKIKVEINHLNTVEELAGKLNTLSSLSSSETDEVKRLILTKVVELTTKAAETQLGEKNFTEAMTTVDKGLEYAANDTKLLSFKDRIKGEQASFEKAEQERIQKAIEVAAQEDLNNHTAAVTIDNLNVYTDEYGDLHITGDLKNHATVSISSIKIYYTVYDVNGDSLGTDYTYGDPFYLEPGENGSFDNYQYGVYQDCTVKITKITWELD
ncbi:zinc ribbon domain-containing protein [Neobacillus cucumis]|uniref:FxLYD domain-containing protein n=1 Tax=Neobacillus cucumis TaxID=1740721 RepID=UPI00203F296D|nr:FxLYD domain-containing protein [Neobacillus cucumis]MCM3727384.1 zinc ribbon domain-containing protein [Neobacillus cucumis]